jgi:DNA repair photolyase
LYGALTTSNRLWMAITYSPQYCIDQYEAWTASLLTRIDFGRRCLDRGYSLGIRIDPTIIPLMSHYDDMIWQLLSIYGHGLIRDRRFWVLRIKDWLYKQLKKNKSWLIDGLIADRGFWSYSLEDKKRLYDCVASHNFQDPIFFCMDSDHA